MRIFFLVRDQDFSGVSGTGIVAEGVEFSNGNCAMRWRGRLSSVAIYESMDMLVSIHGHSGRTRIHYDEEPVSNGKRR